VKVLRNGSEQTISVKVARMPGERAETASQAEPAQGKWGLALRDLDARTLSESASLPARGAGRRGGARSAAEKAGVRQATSSSR